MKTPPRVYLFITLCALVWGSSFILMKKALVTYSPQQVGALRMVTAGLALLPFVLYRLLRTRRRLPYHLLLTSSLMGNVIPAFLFPLAQTKLESGTTGALNALTPLFAMIMGMLVYRAPFRWGRLVGVVIGLGGALVLILHGTTHLGGDPVYALLIVLATALYGLNVNFVKYRLEGVNPVDIAGVGLGLVALPLLAYLLLGTDFVARTATHPDAQFSLLAVMALGAIGTALALWLFFQALALASPVVASSVTYLMPIVALGWALADGEQLGYPHAIGLGLILLGVWGISRWGKE